MEKIKQELANKLKEYVQIILKEYEEYIPEERKIFLHSIKDFSECIKIVDTKTISLLYSSNKIYFPKLAFLVLETLKKDPRYGSIPDHKSYIPGNLIINNNTFIDYINHAVLAGLTPEKYYQENHLHETMHFCGSEGADPIREGLTELKTRELAEKYGLKTSGCGYPKEIQIVLRLQELFGIKVMNSIAFAQSNLDISNILISTYGEEAEELYFSVLGQMKPQFRKYINTNYDGLNAPFKKAEAYSKLNYDLANSLIDNYEQTQKVDTTNSNNSEKNRGRR